MEKHQIVIAPAIPGSHEISASMHVIDVAAYGWESEPWQGFYPADLPEDWRLDYYSNEFRAVVIPAEVWREMTEEMVEEWADAVHDEFRLYFEVTSEQKLSAEQSAAINSLGEQFGGWVCRSHSEAATLPSVWYEGEVEPRQMREVIEQLHQELGSKSRGVIVVSSTNEPWDVASDMRLLVELMGYG